jgi:hypothetical protein
MNQLTTIQFLSTALALLVGIGAVLVLIGAALSLICAHVMAERNQKKQYEVGWRYHQRIEELDLWCGWHFPIAEDICVYLLNGNEDIGTFRERLKRKYGDREKNQEVRAL